MGALDESIFSLADAFHNAALQGEGWYTALDRFAKATGSQTGELIGVGSNAAVPFNMMTDIDPASHFAFVAAGGGDPTINPRVGAGMTSPVLKVMSEEDFITPDEYQRNPHYQEFAIPWDIPHICLSTLDRDKEMLIGLAVLRSHRNGPITSQQKALFAAVAPHVRTAVRTQIALENQGAQLLSRAFASVSMAAFICDQRGKVRATTPAAEQLVEADGVLTLRGGVLGSSKHENTALLSEAINEMSFGTALPHKPMARTVVLKSHDSTQPLLLDVIRLSRPAHELAFFPHVLIVARIGRTTGSEQRASLLQAVFGLTAAEANIALRIAQGDTPAEIAAARQATVGTVRIQIKSVMLKLGVRRQAEVAVKLAPL